MLSIQSLVLPDLLRDKIVSFWNCKAFLSKSLLSIFWSDWKNSDKSFSTYKSRKSRSWMLLHSNFNKICWCYDDNFIACFYLSHNHSFIIYIYHYIYHIFIITYIVNDVDSTWCLTKYNVNFFLAWNWKRNWTGEIDSHDYNNLFFFWSYNLIHIWFEQ